MQRLTKPLFIAMILGVPGSAAADPADAEILQVNAYLETHGIGRNWIAYGAKACAARLLRKTGIQLNWHNGLPPEDVQDVHAVVITFAETAPPGQVPPHALAYSWPYASNGTPITVFYDRVDNFLDSYPSRAPILLGHILAHEIAHVLEGINRHSDTGLMRAHWERMDVAMMGRDDGLPFAAVDRELIRRNVASWRKPKAPVPAQIAVRLTAP